MAICGKLRGIHSGLSRNRAVIKLILIAAIVAFAAASSIHGGALLAGWEHRNAVIAEGAIAGVLSLGLLAPTVHQIGSGPLAGEPTYA